ncbi:MAG: 50S ribosomal protein L17 [Bacteroidetes bacterium]|nr:50S ribosomal protein L17 [Bacteroidota bacterium]MDA0936483.1 50S ribosomal protein L17 [Bacteroidota bacterium]
MKHGKKVNHLGRKVAHRKSMLANMASSLIEHKRINTTVAKAKALKQFVEPLITKSKNDTTHNRRLAFSALRNKYAVTELFRDIAQKVGDRPGGYTRVIKLGNRLGDNASMAMIELVDYNEVYNTEKAAANKSTRRSRSRKKSGASESTAVSESTDAVEEQPTENKAAEVTEKSAPKAKEKAEKKEEDNKATESENEEDA